MSPDFNAKVAQCPGCGTPLEFTVGTSRLVVCETCKFLVARSDRGIESFGKVADLVPTGARLTLHLEGRLQSIGFRVVGRTQLKWAQGVWDEWYLAFDDGRWGWLAEAQGRYYLSFKAEERPVPAWSSLRPGKVVPLGNLGHFVASDLKQASYVAAVGELPERILLDGTSIRTADLTSAKGGFATLDYGPEGDEADVYVGREVSFDELHLDPHKLAAPPKLERIKGEKLTCPTCNGPLELKVPDQTMRVACPYCASLLDTTQGTLQHLAQLKKRSTAIPIGAKGTLNGVEYQVIGWLERRCNVEGSNYFWEEYLLYDSRTAGFRFLVCSDGHWSFVEPVPAGEIEVGVRGPVWKGRLFKTFSEVDAFVSGVLGEFYWAVALEEKVHACDYVAPPESLSEERSPEEVNWSHATYLDAEVVKSVFQRPKLRSPQGVGMMQPNPWAPRVASMWWPLLLGIAGAVALFIFLATRPSQVLFEQSFEPHVGALGRSPGPLVPAVADPEERAVAPGEDMAIDPTSPENGTVRISEPFRVEQGNRNLEVSFSANVDNSWAALAGALVNQTTNEVVEFGLEASHYHGIEGGESWSEGSRTDETYLSALDPGEYVLRTEVAWEKGKAPPRLQLKLTSGVARLTHLFLALAALLVLPGIALWRNGAFEKARWDESNV